MKHKLLVFFSVLLFTSLIISPSCKTEDPIFGTLTITAYNPVTGAVVPNIQINVAKSLAELKAGSYYRTGWTNDKGEIYFGEMPPMFYYYGAQGWDDYGAVQVDAGNDFYVHLYLNTPHTGGK